MAGPEIPIFLEISKMGVLELEVNSIKIFLSVPSIFKIYIFKTISFAILLLDPDWPNMEIN